MINTRILVLAWLLLALALSPTLAQSDPLRIVTTTTQATDVITILTAGVPETAVMLTGLMGAGVDPHLYQPTEADINAMNAADVVIYSGLHLEGQFDEVFAALSEKGTVIYALSKPVKDAGFVFGGFDLSEELQDVDDPHFWFDPRNWQLVVQGAADELIAIDPDNAEIYQTNAADYNDQLMLLYEWGVVAMSTVPEDQRVLVTSHDAFQYFGDAFGWEVRGLQGISTEDEAGVADIQDLAAFVKDRAIPVMFVESSVPPDTIQAVQEAITAEGGSVQLGVRELFSDAMGGSDEFGGTYIGMIAQNIYTILQSYQLAGLDITIPDYPAELEPQPSEALLAVETES